MKSEKGQSFIELLIAMGVFTLIVSAVVFLILDSYVSHRAGKEKTLAAFLAEEGLEASRSIRNNNWDDLEEGNHGVILSKNGWEFFEKDNDLSDRLSEGHRVIIIEDIDPDRKKVESLIEWNLTENRPQEVILTTYLTNWQKAPSFSVFLDSSAYSVVENEGRLFFTVELSTTSDEIVTVDYETVDGTAVSPNDYRAASSTIIFSTGTISETLEIRIANDTEEEGNETFSIVLSNPQNVELGNPSEAIVTILDDDAPAQDCWGIATVCDSSCEYSNQGSLRNYYIDPHCSSNCPAAGSFYTNPTGSCSGDGTGSCYKMENSSTQYLSCSQDDSCDGECDGRCAMCRGLNEEQCIQQDGCFSIGGPWGSLCLGACTPCQNFNGDESGCDNQIGCDYESKRWFWILDNSSLGYSISTQCEWYD